MPNTRTAAETSLVAEWLGLPGLTNGKVVALVQDCICSMAGKGLSRWAQARATRQVIIGALKGYTYTNIGNGERITATAAALARTALEQVDWTQIAQDFMERLEENAEVGSCGR